MYDIAVIGGGPAGLSAAVNARARNKSVLVVTNDYRESPLYKAEWVDNYLGMPGRTGPELLEAYHSHAEAMGTVFRAGRALNIMPMEGTNYIGIGSDHTDREMEAVSIHKSKQVCLKPCSVEFWDYEEVKDHLPQLRLISTQVVDGKEIDYQNGVAGDLLPFDVIIEKVQKEVPLEDCLIYTGTVPLLNGFLFGEQFSARLVDDQLGRELSLTYKIHVIDEH